MGIKDYKPVEVATFVFTVLNSIIIAIGGYLLIGRHEGEMFQSTTKLNQIQTEISKIQLSVADTNARLDIRARNADITEKSTKLIESVRPKFDFSIDSKVELVHGGLTITFNVVNNGEFELWVKPNRFLLSDKPYRNNLANLKDHKNYVLSINYEEINTVRQLEPKATRGHTFTVKVDTGAPNKLFYYMEYRVGTVKQVVNLVDSMAQQLGVHDVKTLSEVIVYRYGTILL
jgi:hypothetical protein